MTSFFVLVFVVHLGLRLWLGLRQIRHVERAAGVVPAAFAATIPLADHQRAARYTVAKQRLAALETCVEALWFLLLTWGGGMQWLAGLIGRWYAPGLAFDFIFVATVVVALALAGLPFEWIRRFRIEQSFGFNRMTPALFLADLLKMAAVGALLGTPLLLAVLAWMRYGGPAWWLGAWAFWALFSLALTVLYPVAIAPLFNRFTPLADAALRARIGALLRRTGFRDNGVFTMDGSRRSTHGNAYFTGMGSGKRIVFYDTLVERLAPEEIEAVLAHELGHFRLRHIVQGMVLSLGVALAWLALLAWLRGQPWFAASLGVAAPAAGASDGVLLVLFFLVLPQLGFLLAPLRSAYSRRHEFQADAYAARHASARALVRALVKLYQDNAATLTPDPLHSAFYDSHPPASLRIDRLDRIAPPGAAAA